MWTRFRQRLGGDATAAASDVAPARRGILRGRNGVCVDLPHSGRQVQGEGEVTEDPGAPPTCAPAGARGSVMHASPRRVEDPHVGGTF